MNKYMYSMIVVDKSHNTVPVGFGCAARTHIFRLINTQNKALCAPPLNHRTFAAPLFNPCNSFTLNALSRVLFIPRKNMLSSAGINPRFPTMIVMKVIALPMS